MPHLSEVETSLPPTGKGRPRKVYSSRGVREKDLPTNYFEDVDALPENVSRWFGFSPTNSSMPVTKRGSHKLPRAAMG